MPSFVPSQGNYGSEVQHYPRALSWPVFRLTHSIQVDGRAGIFTAVRVVGVCSCMRVPCRFVLVCLGGVVVPGSPQEENSSRLGIGGITGR